MNLGYVDLTSLQELAKARCSFLCRTSIEDKRIECSWCHGVNEQEAGGVNN